MHFANKQSSKRDGLEKAVYRIEQAIKRSRTQGPEEDENTQHLQALLSEAQGLLPATASPALSTSPSVDPPRQQRLDLRRAHNNSHSTLPQTQAQMFSTHQSTRQSAQRSLGTLEGSSQRLELPNNPFRRAVAEKESPDDNFSVDDAENPLQLLARASDLSASNKPTSYLSPPRFPGAVGDQQLRDFFGPFRPSLDIGEDIDPIELGLVTEEEAAILFA